MRLIVGVSGASGVIMSKYLLQELKKAGAEIHLVVTQGAELTWKYECREPIDELYKLADHVYTADEIDALIASGSFVTDGMIIIPCSMKSLAGVVSGYADNLLLRAADVCLKERRRLVLVPREMPLGKVHLRNLSDAAGLGCSIIPPVMTFYDGHESVEDMIMHVVNKILMQFGIECEDARSWKGCAYDK